MAKRRSKEEMEGKIIMVDDETPKVQPPTGANPIAKALTGTGDLTVEQDEDSDIDLSGSVPILPVGKKFMVEGHEYKVVYVNEGKKRFTCIPCKDV
jgi:hypothetical protein